MQTANNHFTTGLYQALFPEKSQQNLIFSPFSLHAVLGMAGLGARGTTKSEIMTGLQFTATNATFGKGYNSIIERFQNASSPETFTLLIANRVYGQTGYTLNESFVNLLQDRFQVVLEQLDFSDAKKSASRINKWVASTTRNKIQDIISEGSLNDETRLVLVNAIYFKGLWEHKFDPEETTKEEFRVTKSEKIKVDMMHINEDFRYAELLELDAAAVSLPYKGGRLSMIIILPKAVDGLPKIQSSIGTILNGRKSIFRERSRCTEVKLSLPKFKIESTLDNLKEVLQSLGMNQIFSDKDADFSGMMDVDDATDPNVRIYVSTVIQKAFIEVNEKGAEAAAATVMDMCCTCCGDPDPKPVLIPFVVDHPFYFQIVGHANGLDLVLFSGHCNDPTQ